MRIGISSYTYTWGVGVPGSEPQHPLTAFDLIDKAQVLGVPCVQIADNLPLHQFDEKQLSSLKLYADAHGISIEVGSRGLTSENLDRYITIADQLQSPIVRMVIDEPGYEPDEDTVIGVICEAVPRLESLGIALVIENHDRFKAETFRKMVYRSNSAMVGICLDSVNSLGAGEGIETVVETLGSMTLNLHAKEFIIKRVPHKMGFIVEGSPLGKGMLPLEYILQHVSDRCQSAILEQWTPPSFSIEDTVKKEDEWAGESVAYMKTIIGVNR